MVTRTGLTQPEFYRVFASVDECYLAAFDEGLARLSRVVADAAGCEERWLDQVRAGLLALLGFLDDEPSWKHLLISQTCVAQAPVSERRQHAVGVLAGLLDARAPRETVDTERLALSSSLTAELVVGGVFSVIRTRIVSSDEPLMGLAPGLMLFIVAPYLGRTAARAESARITGGLHDRRAPAGRLAVRTTYRTSRVLRSIGATPGLSNREIADAAGLTDEGQTSKLLARLERRELIENVGLGAACGEPNAWHLTPYGRDVTNAIGHGFDMSAAVGRGRRIRGAA